MQACTGLGCSSGYVLSFRGGQPVYDVCSRCGGTGRVAGPSPAEPRDAGCPYNACGGRCRGAGYYDYHGTMISCRPR